MPVSKSKISPRDPLHLCTFIILICRPFSKSFNSSILRFPLIYGNNMVLDVLTQLRPSYLLCHKNTNLRGQLQFTAWQAEAWWKIVSSCSLTSGWNTHFISSCRFFHGTEKFLTYIVDYSCCATFYWYSISSYRVQYREHRYGGACCQTGYYQKAVTGRERSVFEVLHKKPRTITKGIIIYHTCISGHCRGELF